MASIAYNDAGEPFIADDGTQDVPRLPISDWSASNLITGADPNQPTLFPGIREGLSQAGRLLTGNAPFSPSADIQDRLFGFHSAGPRVGRQPAPIEYSNRLKTWPEQMATNAVAGDPASMSVNPQTGEIHTSPETIERGLDIAGMAGGGVLGAKADVRPPLIDWENWGKTSNPIERFQDMARQNQQGVVNGRLMSDTSQPGAAIASLAPRFYSALENGVKNLTHTNSATADEWVSALKKQPGVKQEEIDWTLHDLPQGQITKSELEQYIKERKIELKEIVKGGQSYPYKTADEWQNAIDKAEKQQNWSEAQKLIVAWEQFEGVGSDVNGTKYDKYQLPGGTNYREHLSILPRELSPETQTAMTKSNELQKRTADLMSEWKRISEENPPGHPDTLAAYHKLSEVRQERDAAVQDALELRKKYKEGQFNDHHYADQGIANVIMHARTNDRVIPGVGNSLHIETGQSDWHQKGRELGYKGDTAKLDKLQAIDDKLLASTEDIYGNPDLKEAIQTAIDRKVISPEEGKYYTENSKIDAPNAVPNAPFKKEAWVDVILKNMIRKAAEEGKDAISWTPGEAQVKRWKTLAKGNGEFLKRLYDETWVNKANAIAKKFGGKVEEGSIPAKTTPYKFQDQWTIPGRPEMYSSKEEVLKVLAQPVHVLRITPQLRDAALNKGFSLFADSGRAGAPLTALTRVEHNPFKLAEMEKQHGVKLTPVENNPFTTDAYHGAPHEFRGNDIDTRNNKYTIEKFETKKGTKYQLYNDVNGQFLQKNNKYLEFDNEQLARDWLNKNVGVEFYSTPNPKLAADYSGYSNITKGKEPNILPLKLDTREYHTFDAKGKTWDAVNQFAINEANQLKKKGIIINNVKDDANTAFTARGPQTVYITLDPSTVRSRFAKFDPAKFGESGLLKSDTGEVGSALASWARAKEQGYTIDAFKGGFPYDYNTTPVKNAKGEIIGNADKTPVELTELNSPNQPYAGFFSDKHEVANRFAQNITSEGSVWPVKLKFENPLVIDGKGKPAAAFQFESIAKREGMEKELSDFKRAFTDKYDGAIIKNTKDEGTVYVPRYSHQIRSKFAQFALENKGLSGLLKAAGVPIDISNQDGKDPLIDNTHDVPYGAGASNNGLIVHIDKSIPDRDPKLGDLDLHKTLALHERTEKPLMEAGMPYELAHKIATKAEKGLVEALGGDWNEYEKVMDGYLKGTEHKNAKDPPPDLYKKPYPHREQELLKRNADYESMTHQATDDRPGVGISGKSAALGAAKAAEWLAFLGSRNYPKINGPMTAAWIAQWPIMGHMLKDDVKKQLKAGVKPEDIEFKPGSIGDLFGLVSSLKAKFGDKADHLQPVEGNPFVK